ncbi:MAG: nucleotide sugar dehydrogenase [Chloroflexi bacterium]|nr:nucleotide sugar dehydrogenase [Chloroflexota bacterium]
MTSQINEICVVGLGYIGLPTAATLASRGFNVIGVDINQRLVEQINRGETSMEESGLDALVKDVVKSGWLKAFSTPQEADAFIIAVPTPITLKKRPDLRYVKAAARSVATCLRRGNLVVLESTVPPGTTTGALRKILETSGLTAGCDFHLAHCPERVLPGDIMREIRENDRIVGGIDEASTQVALSLYKTFVKGNVFATSATVAETTKLAENIYRDVNIALANELSNVCSQLGVDVWEVIKLANKHPRVHLHQPGPGVGGHCIGVVPWFLVSAAHSPTPLIRLTRKINGAQPEVVANKVLDMVDAAKSPKIAVLGVAYKANVRDTRETPALPIIQLLEKAGAKVSVTDQLVQEFTYPICSLEEALAGADAFVLVTDHRQYRQMDPQWAGKLMRTKNALDTRNCLKAIEWQKTGFRLERLGA